MSSTPSCYCYWGGQISNTCGNTVPCGTSEPGYYNSSSKTQLCCVAGDTCGANSICKSSTAGDHPALGSGFYLGGCTDSTFDDPLCRKDCNDRHSTLIGNDVVYEDDLNAWSCCGRTNDGENLVNCSAPITQLSFEVNWKPNDFPGPVNQILTPAITTIPTSSTPTSTQQSIASIHGTTASSAPPTNTATNQSSLSTGAKAGIGIGVVLGVLALIGLATAFVVMRKRRKNLDKSSNDAAPFGHSHQPGRKDQGYAYEKAPGYPYEDHQALAGGYAELGTGAAEQARELDGQEATYELDSTRATQRD